MNIMLTEHYKVMIRLLLLSATLSVLSCGGSETTPAPSPEPVAVESPTPEVLNQIGQSETVVINEGLGDQYLDSDKDGLSDDIDYAPLIPLTLLEGNHALSISTLASYFDDELAESGIVVSGQTVKGKLRNFEHFSAPFYLLWYTENGVQAELITLDENAEFISVAPEALVNSVSVTAMNQESIPFKVSSYSAFSPIIFKSNTPLFTGQRNVLKGWNLQHIDEIWAGDINLAFTIINNTIELELPDTLRSPEITWHSGNQVHAKSFNIQRIVRIMSDKHLVQPSQWTALGKDSKMTLTPASSSVHNLLELAIPLSRHPEHIRFYHPLYRDVEGIIWPHQDRLILGAQSTLEAIFVNKYKEAITDDNILVFYSALQQLFDSALGQSLVSPIHSILASEYSFENERLLQDILARLESILAQQNLVNYFPSPFRFTLNQSQGGSSVFDYLDDTFSAIFKTNTMYEPISNIIGLRAKPGSNTYADLSIGMYRDLSTCEGLTPTLPKGIWPSDLCVSNSAVYFASLKVTRELDDKVLKSHIKDFIDTNMIGASGWGLTGLDEISYITSDKGEPLCHMQSCYLEFITGGLGLGTNVDLNREQLKVYHKVLGRTMLERVIIPTVSWALGKANIDISTGKCLADFIVSQSISGVKDYGIMIVEYKKKLDGANSEDEVLAILKDTIIKYAYEVASGMLTSGKLPTCLSANLRKEYLESLANKVGDVAEKIAVPLRVANTATQAFQGFNAVFTPEKFTFAVAPRAAITRISTANTGQGIPELLSNVDDDMLFIRGTKFVYLQSDNQLYWPILKLRDRHGNQQTLQLNQSHKVDVSDLSWVDIKIPVSDLRPLMKKLRGEIVNVSIIMNDQNYPEFSPEGLPLPGRDIRWIGQPKLFSASPQNIRQGRLLSLRGENLQTFATRSDLKLKYIQANDASRTGETTRHESASDKKITFRTSSQLPLGLYKLRLETSNPNLQLSVPDDVGKASFTGAVNVIPKSASLIALYDAGAKIDDGIRVVVNNDDGELISQNNELLSLALDENNPLPAVSMWWDDRGLSAANGDSVPRQITVICDAGGSDQICTYRVKGEIKAGAKFENINVRGKLRDGEQASHRFSTPP